MKYENLEKESSETYKRLTGVTKFVFDKMLSELKRLAPVSQHKVTGAMRGPKPKLTLENKILMLLTYYRAYRTFLGVGVTYGISET